MESGIKPLKNLWTWKATVFSLGRKVIDTKCVYDFKQIVEGNVVRPISGLVSERILQVKGIEFIQVFSAVKKNSNVRFRFAFSRRKVNASTNSRTQKAQFLIVSLNRIVYARKPEGFIRRVKKAHVFLFRKKLYGLCQSLREWSYILHSFVTGFGCVHSATFTYKSQKMASLCFLIFTVTIYNIVW